MGKINLMKVSQITPMWMNL